MSLPLRPSFYSLLALILTGVVQTGIALGAESLPSQSQADLVTMEVTILSWLECEECTDVQLNAVVKLGPKAVPLLILALDKGPTVDKLLSLTVYLKKSYSRLLDYKKNHPTVKIPLNERDYIVAHVSHLLDQYQVRAATAIGAIGGASAKNALELSLDNETSSLVQDVVQETLKSMAARQSP